MAVKVLPEPVAICTKALGLKSLNDFSKLVMASIWQSRKLSVGSSGISNKPLLKDFSL